MSKWVQKEKKHMNRHSHVSSSPVYKIMSLRKYICWSILASSQWKLHRNIEFPESKFSDPPYNANSVIRESRSLAGYRGVKRGCDV